MASGVRGAGDAGEGEWLKVAELKAMAGAKDPHAKVHSSIDSFLPVVVFFDSMQMLDRFVLYHW